ncbi:MAG: hypothetical protein LAT78_08775 [Roseinatronobacter sp.]|nr:hypothetical protein [Roseinatronobacter sp.]
MARVQAGHTTSWPLYRGFKALADGTTRQDEYICLPIAPRAVFWPPMAKSIRAAGLDTEQAEQACAAIDSSTAIFTQTQAQGQRNSWLTTLRRAPPQPAAIANWLAPLARHDEAAKTLVTSAARRTLVHLAGGEDRTKGQFLTIYLESPPAEALHSLRALM